MFIKKVHHPDYVSFEICDQQSKNALGMALGLEILDKIKLLKKDLKSSCRALVITAKSFRSDCGQKIWISGGNLKELAGYTRQQAKEYIELYSRIGRSFAELEIPVICMIDGAAIGGGAELALWADLRAMSEDSSLDFKQSRIGLGPGYGGCGRLVQLVGLALAQRYLLLGRRLDAKEAKEANFVHFIYKSNKNSAADCLNQLIGQIKETSPIGNKIQKCMLSLFSDTDNLHREQQLFLSYWQNTDHKNFLKKFLNKPETT